MAQEDRCEQVLQHFKKAIKCILKNHHGDVVRVDFDSFTICVEDRCAQYGNYEMMLFALVLVDHFVKKLREIGGGASAKSLNISEFQQGHA